MTKQQHNSRTQGAHTWPEHVESRPDDILNASLRYLFVYAPNRLAHMMEENSPEMQTIFRSLR